MKRRLIIIVLIIALLAAGCSQSDNIAGQREKLLSDNTADIVVGVAWPFEAKNDGFREGLQLALEEINQNGAAGHQIKLVQEDDQSSVTAGLSVAQSFANNLEMSAVIGHRSSAVAVPASKVYENAGLLLLAPSATSPSLTEGGVKHVFRLIPNDSQLGDKMADYAKSKDYKNIVVFYANDEYGRGLANSFEDSAKANGLQIIDRISDYKDSDDLKRLVKKWRLLGCDAVFIAETMPDGADFIVQLQAAGLNVPLMGGDGLDSQDLLAIAGKEAEGVVVASIFNPQAADENVQLFVKKYRDKYGEEPRKYAAQAYDALHLLAKAIEKANSRSPADIARALREQKSWQGVSGARAFDANGEVHHMASVLKRVVNGRLEQMN
ncbi:Leucine-, isoleucine-, valine-, threonine-, and alanine-binding protein [Paenibacillus plantiphilus]|uniref:Leucine-, isoleucine-, valine-, threonine-, and alanine-binding protein n=1 Tax=Paenibacillus plantiphilus TaxID=2905650 RepID=A0ABN8GTC6_9BACL|nr:ABC transporter substrate-binding protein [Paenibacillus plantiphilus]CAH1216244.1 Leucine-, isoleucine-, valine-, threonine-, and alanine-binding protein [Paenibacillus plantiphilus]